jgi:hypothetical protein
MQEVFNHPWINEGFSFPPENIYKEPNQITSIADLSADIVSRLVIFGYSREEIRKAFEGYYDSSVPNPIRSTYFLLKDMVEREQSRLVCKKSIEGVSMNAFLQEKESSSITLISSSNHSLYPSSTNQMTYHASKDTIQTPPEAYASNRNHSAKIPAKILESKLANHSLSSSLPSDMDSKGIFGFSIAQVAANQIQRWYSVPSSIYNSLSETTNALLYKRDPNHSAVGQKTDGRTSSNIKKDPAVIINDIISVLSGTDARWLFWKMMRQISWR